MAFEVAKTRRLRACDPFLLLDGPVGNDSLDATRERLTNHGVVVGKLGCRETDWLRRSFVGRTEGEEVPAKVSVDGIITGSLACSPQEGCYIVVGGKKIETDVVELMRRHPSILAARRQENVFEKRESQGTAVSKQLGKPTPDVFIVARISILPTDPRPEPFGRDWHARLQNANHQPTDQITQFGPGGGFSGVGEEPSTGAKEVEKLDEAGSLKFAKEPCRDLPRVNPLVPWYVLHRDSETREDGIDRGFVRHFVRSDLGKEFAREPRRARVAQIKQPMNESLPIGHGIGTTKRIGSTRVFGVGAIRINQDFVELRGDLPREVGAGHCAENELGEVKIAIRCGEYIEDVVLEFEAHQTGCRTVPPVSRCEVRIFPGQVLQGIEKGACLSNAEPLRVTMAKHPVRVGRDAPVRKGPVEVSKPGVQPSKRGWNAVPGAEESEDPALRASL